MSEEKKNEEVKDVPASTPGSSPEKKLEKKINIIAIVAILAIIGVVFYVISKDAARRNSEKAEASPVYNMESRSVSGPAVPAPPPVTPPPGMTAVPKKSTPKAPPPDAWASLPDPVAEMDGKPISKQTVIDAFNSQFPGGKPPPLNPEQIKKAGYGLVNNYVEHQILLDLAKSKTSVSHDEVVAMLQKTFKDVDPVQLNMLKASLTAQNMTMDSYIQQKANDAITRDTALLIKYGETLEKDIKVSDAELKKTYDELKDRYFVIPADPAGSMRASHILFAVNDQKDQAAMAKALDQAKKTLAQIRENPAKFGEIAKAVSDCPSKKDGGSLGAFNKGDMVKPFEEAVGKLKEGEISEPVLTQFGYHIIRRDPAVSRQEKSLSEVKDELTRYIKATKVKDILSSTVEKARQERKVKILVPPPPKPAVPKAD